jgi:hypothetical protein
MEEKDSKTKRTPKSDDQVNNRDPWTTRDQDLGQSHCQKQEMPKKKGK